MVNCSEVVIVCGTPGAWCNLVCKEFYREGYLVLWEGQERTDSVSRYFSKNFQNEEINNIHRQLLGMGPNQSPELFARKLDYYEPAFPDPEVFLSQFGKKRVVLSSNSMSLLLDAWLPFATMVIDVRATEQEDLAMLKQWSSGNLADSVIAKIREIHVSAYLRHVDSFENTIQITNSEIKSADRFNYTIQSIFESAGKLRQCIDT